MIRFFLNRKICAEGIHKQASPSFNTQLVNKKYFLSIFAKRNNIYLVNSKNFFKIMNDKLQLEYLFFTILVIRQSTSFLHIFTSLIIKVNYFMTDIKIGYKKIYIIYIRFSFIITFKKYTKRIIRFGKTSAVKEEM